MNIYTAINNANKNPIAALPSAKDDIHHASIAPSIKNSPCATLTILITPKTKLNPRAMSDNTAAWTRPSSEAKSR